MVTHEMAMEIQGPSQTRTTYLAILLHLMALVIAKAKDELANKIQSTDPNKNFLRGTNKKFLRRPRSQKLSRHEGS